MSKTIAIAGKGGTGKTTFCGLLINYLTKRGGGPILAVDADADSNLPSLLGISADKTIVSVGSAREDFFNSKNDVPAGMPKETILELKFNQTIIESKDVDLLVMGRPEGQGCYCYINNVLRKHLDLLSGNYPYVIIDNEAGLEHLSRRTTRKIDYLVIVSNYSLNGLRSAVSIKDLSREIDLDISNVGLVVNNAPASLSPSFEEELSKTGVPFLGALPADELVQQFDIEKKPIGELPDSSSIVAALVPIAEKIIG